MKKILITGANSFVGTSFENWMTKWPDKYSVDSVDMIDGSWKEGDFSGYDVVFHVAGIAHVDAKANLERLYYKINRDLTIETAKKAKADGVKQFIFMSSIIIYGDSSFINKKSVITTNTKPQPTSFYGKSKLQAEEGIIPLQDNSFNIVIVRPPMIYGKSSKGNYPRLANMAQKLPIFPDIENERSMLHIDNLCEFIQLMIENEEHGTFYPQNAEYVKTSTMVQLIAEAHGRKMKLTKLANPLLILLGKKVGMVNKVFGNLVYDMSMSSYKDNYCVRNLEQSIQVTERVQT